MDSSFKNKLRSVFGEDLEEGDASKGEVILINHEGKRYIVMEQSTVLANKLQILQPPDQLLQPSASKKEKWLSLEAHLNKHNVSKTFLMKRSFAGDQDEDIYFKCIDNLHTSLAVNDSLLNETLITLKTPSSSGEFTSKLFGFLTVNKHQEVILADESASIVCVYTDILSFKIETFLNRLVYIRKCFFTAEFVCPQVIFDLDYCVPCSELKVASNPPLRPNYSTRCILYLINKSHPMIMDNKKHKAVLLHVYVLDTNSEYLFGMTECLLLSAPQLRNGCVYKMTSAVPIMDLKPFRKLEFAYVKFNDSAPQFQILPNACSFVESSVKFPHASRYRVLSIAETLNVISESKKPVVSFTGLIQGIYVNSLSNEASSRTGSFRGRFVPFFGNSANYETLSVLFREEADDIKTVKVYLNNWEHLGRVKGLVKNMKVFVRHALVSKKYLKCCALTSFEPVQYLDYGLNISDVDTNDWSFDETALPLNSMERKAEESPLKEIKSI